ncbi:MAG: hypothetical protein ACYDG2_18360 [Ruminiclostridium sp.]
MLKSCFYKGQTPMNLPMCLHCSLFLETCIPIADHDGFSNGECGNFLCPSCDQPHSITCKLLNQKFKEVVLL